LTKHVCVIVDDLDLLVSCLRSWCVRSQYRYAPIFVVNYSPRRRCRTGGI